MASLSDLHRHLDGSLRPDTLMELTLAAGLPPPADVRFEPGMGLGAALAHFRITLAALQTPEAVERVAREIVEDAAADGVTTLEIRFAPQLHGFAQEEVVDAALSGTAGRAGLILCGLYGEAPEVLQGHVTLAASRPGVVGIDLAGGPTLGDRFDLADYAEPFARARQLGIHRTVHAGEGRPVQEIRTAIEVLHAERIGHGLTLLDDSTVLDLVLTRGITIEACPTSNWQVGAIASIGAHPLAKWLDLGVKATVNTDNTLMSDVSASQEYARALTIDGMDAEKLSLAIQHGHAGAFHR